MRKLTIDKLRQFISAGQCPWCDNHHSYIVLARHTNHAHGISAYELREMAGLNRYSSICDPDYSDKMRQIVKSRPAELQDRILKLGRTPEVAAQRDFKLRPEGRTNQLTWLLSPQRIEMSVVAMHTPEARAKMRLASRNCSPEIVKQRTERVLQGHIQWIATHTKEERSENRKHAYQTWIKNTSQEYVDEHFTNMRKMIPHDAQVKGAQAAAKVMPLYHADSEWKRRWWINFQAGMRRRAENKALKIQLREQHVSYH